MSGPSLDDIKKAVADLRGWSQERLAEMVKCPSLQGAEKGAQDVAQRIMEEELGMTTDRWALDVDTLKSQPGFSPVGWDLSNSECVVGTYDAVDKSAKSLIINGHVDVVPVDPPHLWTEKPFVPYVRDGWMFGRGAGDMKGGIVAAMAALLALRKLGYRPAGRLHFETVPEEENTGNGAVACCARGYKADACIIPEPFHDMMSSGQVGVIWMTVDLDGKPAHVLDTTAGLSAIQSAYVIVERLKQLEVAMNADKHPLFADHKRPINFNLGTINGGNWPSSVASHCTFQMRIGVYPGVNLAETRADLERRVRDHAKELGVAAKVSWVGFQAEGYVGNVQHPLFSELGASFYEATGRTASVVPLTATTDCRAFKLYHNIEATCLGPEAKRIHGIDECVSLQSMEDVSITYALFIQRWCGLAPLL